MYTFEITVQRKGKSGWPIVANRLRSADLLPVRSDGMLTLEQIALFEFEGLPERGHVVLDTMRLEELPGNRPRVTIQSVYPVCGRSGWHGAIWHGNRRPQRVRMVG